MSFVPGMGILKGMALTLRRFFAPKVTIRYPEVAPDIAVKYRGRLELLYDEHGPRHRATCSPVAQARPLTVSSLGPRAPNDQSAAHCGALRRDGDRRTGGRGGRGRGREVGGPRERGRAPRPGAGVLRRQGPGQRGAEPSGGTPASGGRRPARAAPAPSVHVRGW